MGHGWPPVNKARKFGMRPSLSIDVVTTVPGDMFTQIRAAFGAERARVNAVCWDLDIPIPEDMLTAEDMLKMATLDGAHVAGVEDRTGSLTPGKQADVVVIDATAINVGPIHDPAAAVTLCADVSNVEHVLVAGSFVKRDFKLAGDVARAMSLVEDSRDHLVAAAAKAAVGEAGDGAGVTTHHLVRRAADLSWSAPAGPLAGSTGLEQWSVVDATHAGRAHRLRPEPARAGRAGAQPRPLLRGEPVRHGRARRRPDARRGGPARAGWLRADPDRRTPLAAQRGRRGGPLRPGLGAGAAARARLRHPAGAGLRRDRRRSTPTSATRGPVGTATSPRRTWTRPGSRRSCWRRRRACGQRCWSTAGSR